MDYELQSIKVADTNIQNKGITLDGTNNNTTVVVTNKKLNEQYFYDTSKVENVFNTAN